MLCSTLESQNPKKHLHRIGHRLHSPTLPSLPIIAKIVVYILFQRNGVLLIFSYAQIMYKWNEKIVYGHLWRSTLANPEGSGPGMHPPPYLEKSWPRATKLTNRILFLSSKINSIAIYKMLQLWNTVEHAQLVHKISSVFAPSARNTLDPPLVNHRWKF